MRYEEICNRVDDGIIKSLHRDRKEIISYVGMTMTSVHNRMYGHLSGQKYKHTSNPLYRHDIEYHNGCPQKYTTRILARDRRILPVKITEGLYIEAQLKGTSMNDKNKFLPANLAIMTS